MFRGPSSVVREQTGRDAFLRADGLSPEMIFGRIDAELCAGRRVWLTGGVFERLSAVLGHKKDGERWLIINPRDYGDPACLCRFRDALLSALGLLVLSPVFLLIALLVKRSSPGPVFYQATVVGECVRPFTWYKFRSMRQISVEEDERIRREQYRAFARGALQNNVSGGNGRVADFKVVDNSRVTRVGAVLRKYSLDELPQLVNVVKGQMSLVGPRPCLPYEAEVFPKWASRRFELRPGLTGVWQVYGRSRVKFEEALAMDVYYVYARSFWLDVILILRTVAVVLRGQGAM